MWFSSFIDIKCSRLDEKSVFDSRKINFCFQFHLFWTVFSWLVYRKVSILFYSVFTLICVKLLPFRFFPPRRELIAKFLRKTLCYRELPYVMRWYSCYFIHSKKILTRMSIFLGAMWFRLLMRGCIQYYISKFI